MTQTPSSLRLNPFKRALPFVALAISAGFVAAPAWAQSPRAGTSIGNQATATYNDGSNIPRNVQSNSVTTFVQQVTAVDLTDPRAIKSAPGAPIAFPHTIQNTGNGVDSFAITVSESGTDDFNIGYKIYADANQDGVPDNTTEITVTPSLQPNEKFNFVVVGNVPNTQTVGKNASITVTATSVVAPTLTPAASATDANADTVAVSNNAIVNVVKSLAGPDANGEYTYTLRYTNSANTPASRVVLTDVLNAKLAYVADSGRGSVTGSTLLTDVDTDGAQAGANATVKYSAVGQTVTATIDTVGARTTGSISFRVKVRDNTVPGSIPNTADLSYDDDNNVATDPIPGRSNTVDLNVAQTPRVAITSDIKADAVAQGSTVVFTNTVTNSGNGTDTFNITLAKPGSFPAGTVFQLFQTGGAATLLDSNGDSIPDTGPLAPGASYDVSVKAILPATASATASAINVIATSTAPGAPQTEGVGFATGVDSVPSITASTVDITNRTAGTGDTATRVGAGAYAPGFIGLARTIAPGTVATFQLSANNNSGRDDNYALSFASNPTLPTGFSVVFKDLNGQIITNTGNIPAGGTFDYVAEVTVPAGATPSPVPTTEAPQDGIDLVFTVTSGATNATDSIKDNLKISQVRALTATPNNQGQVFPGSSINYAHVITNDGNATETNIAVSTADSLNGFSSVLYADTNGNGLLDSDEQSAGPLTSVPSIAAKANFPVIVVVFGPSNQFTSGSVDTTTLTATVGGLTATATDTTTIVAGDVVLTKSQSVNGGAPTQGNATALPGQTIKYTILVRNTGGAAVNNVVVSDTTPAFTKYTETGGVASYSINGGTLVTVATPAPDPAPQGVTYPLVSAPADGAAGTIIWTIPTLNPGEVATVTFNVIINK